MNVDQGAPSAPLGPPRSRPRSLRARLITKYFLRCPLRSLLRRHTVSLSPLTKRVWDEGKVCSRPRPARPSVRCPRLAVNAVMPRQGEMAIPRIYRVPMARCDTQCNTDRPPARAVPTPPPPHSFLSSSSLLRRRRRQRRGGAASGGGAAAVAECGRGADEQISLAFKAAARPPSSVSLSLFPSPSHVAARQPPPRRKALLSAAQRMDARRMEPLANSSACVRARLPLRHQLGRLCPATQRRPRPSGSGPPEDGEDRIVSAVDDELPSGRVGRERGAMFAT